MRLARVAAPDFDLALTLNCGQVFHWFPHRKGFAGMIGDEAVYVEQRNDELLTSAKPKIVSHYFALDHPLIEICRSFPSDPPMLEAANFCRGLRIIRQPIWECLATFITSSMKQVAHIAQISHTLRRRFGRLHRLGELELFSYPSPARIASASETELRDCALGYRAKNLLATARQISSGQFDLDSVRSLDDAAARQELCRLPGVGAKIANCVLLFAYERTRAFPIDVWIERVLRAAYFKRKRNVTAKQMHDFSQKYFGEYGGYAQQYLFHHARSHKRKTIKA